MINAITIDGARLGNWLFINFIIHLLSKKFNYFPVYVALAESDALGFKYHYGTECKNDLRLYTDDTILNLLSGPDFIDHGVSFNGFGQLKDIVLSYKHELYIISNKSFNLVDGVFVHVRLDDACQNNPGLEYYRTCLKNINFECGYISSDSPDHPMVKSLISEFNLALYNNSPVETINYAKKFDKLILSGGTFSWWIGVLSKASEIFYPKQKIIWHGDIFVFPEWKGIDL